VQQIGIPVTRPQRDDEVAQECVAGVSGLFIRGHICHGTGLGSMLAEPGKLQKNPPVLSVAAPPNGLSGRRKNGIHKWHLPLYTTIMVAKLTLDKAGRMVLPKALRDELQLSPGDTLEVESSGEQVTLRPLRATTPLQKERGVWVYRTGQELPASVVNDTLRQIRQGRHRAALGKEQ